MSVEGCEPKKLVNKDVVGEEKRRRGERRREEEMLFVYPHQRVVANKEGARVASFPVSAEK